jgi:hypothetical protein
LIYLQWVGTVRLRRPRRVQRRNSKRECFEHDYSRRHRKSLANPPPRFTVAEDEWMRAL